MLIFLGLLSAINAQPHELFLSLAWSVVLLLLFVFTSAEGRIFYISAGWGILVATCGWIGWHGLSLVSLLSVVSIWIHIFSGYKRQGRAMMPLFFFGCGTLLAEIVLGLGLLDPHRSFFGVGWDLPNHMWKDAVRAFLEVWASSWRWVFRITLFIVSFRLFQVAATCRSGFVQGVLLGATVASVYTITQWLGLHTLVLPNQTALWTTLRRWSGLSTDPNAQGILFGLALWLGMLFDSGSAEDRCKISKAKLFSVGLILIGGVLTGSRTFFLIMGCMGIAHCSRFSIRSLALPILMLCCISLSITVLDYCGWLVPMLDELAMLPEGLVRLIRSSSMLRIAQTFGSRLIFTDLSFQVISDHWVFGVGPNRFINYVSLYGQSIPSLGTWIDNANNFYLGIAAECGVIGTVVLLFTVLSHRLVSGNGRSTARANLTMLGVILLIGPHTDFIEVLLVVALLTAVSTREREIPERLSWLCCGVFLVVGFWGVQFREMGVYRWEHEDKTLASRWLSPYAQIAVPCKTQSENSVAGKLILRASYIPSSEPILAHISSRYFSSFITSFSDTTPKQIVVSCPAGFESLSLRVSSQPAWRPYRAWPTTSNDARVLSVQQLQQN